MLGSRDAFKVGFLARCVEDGLTTPAQIHERVKVALDKFAGLLDMAGSAAKGVVGGATGLVAPALKYGTLGALVAPPIAGGLAGFGLSKALDVSDDDVEDVKKRELIDELQQQAQRVSREKQIRDYRGQRKNTGRIFFG